MSKERKRSPQDKNYLVYLASRWSLYYYNDPDAVIVESGLNYWEACKRCQELNHPSGEKIGRYKPCRAEDWNCQIGFRIS